MCYFSSKIAVDVSACEICAKHCFLDEIESSKTSILVKIGQAESRHAEKAVNLENLC